jgi:hypothetical protein
MTTSVEALSGSLVGDASFETVVVWVFSTFSDLFGTTFGDKVVLDDFLALSSDFELTDLFDDGSAVNFVSGGADLLASSVWSLPAFLVLGDSDFSST